MPPALANLCCAVRCGPRRLGPDAVHADTVPAAESIVGRTARGMYLVKRQGLGLDQYGLVDGRAVKRQRLGQAAVEGEEAPAPPPIDVAMVRRVHRSTSLTSRCCSHSQQSRVRSPCCTPNQLVIATVTCSARAASVLRTTARP